MPREYRLYLEDMQEACQKVQRYVEGVSFEAFTGNSMRVDAVLHNLLIIGEAVKGVPDEMRKEHTDIEWRKIAGLRDIVAHEYFGIDFEIIWDVVQNKLPDLNQSIASILAGDE